MLEAFTPVVVPIDYTSRIVDVSSSTLEGAPVAPPSPAAILSSPGPAPNASEAAESVAPASTPVSAVTSQMPVSLTAPVGTLLMSDRAVADLTGRRDMGHGTGGAGVGPFARETVPTTSPRRCKPILATRGFGMVANPTGQVDYVAFRFWDSDELADGQQMAIVAQEVLIYRSTSAAGRAFRALTDVASSCESFTYQWQGGRLEDNYPLYSLEDDAIVWWDGSSMAEIRRSGPIVVQVSRVNAYRTDEYELKNLHEFVSKAQRKVESALTE